MLSPTTNWADNFAVFTAAYDDGSSSNITYAPTNSCTYDGSGSFTYDRDLDSDLTYENSTTLVVTAAGYLDLLAVDHPGEYLLLAWIVTRR